MDLHDGSLHVAQSRNLLPKTPHECYRNSERDVLRGCPFDVDVGRGLKARRTSESRLRYSTHPMLAS